MQRRALRSHPQPARGQVLRSRDRRRRHEEAALQINGKPISQSHAPYRTRRQGAGNRLEESHTVSGGSGYVSGNTTSSSSGENDMTKAPSLASRHARAMVHVVDTVDFRLL
jgi:hypothetical protein